MFVNFVWDESGGERVPVIKYILRETVEKTVRGFIRFTLTIAEKRGGCIIPSCRKLDLQYILRETVQKTGEGSHHKLSQVRSAKKTGWGSHPLMLNIP